MGPFWGGRNGENPMNSKGFGTFPAQKGVRFWTSFSENAPPNLIGAEERKSEISEISRVQGQPTGRLD